MVSELDVYVAATLVQAAAVGVSIGLAGRYLSGWSGVLWPLVTWAVLEVVLFAMFGAPSGYGFGHLVPWVVVMVSFSVGTRRLLPDEEGDDETDMAARSVGALGPDDEAPWDDGGGDDP